jgi:predicted membrane protein
METKNYRRNHPRNKLIFGSLVITVGIVLFGLNFGFIPQAWKPILFSWQMLVILWGIVELFYMKFFKAIILLLVGGFFLIPDFYRIYPEYFRWTSENFVQIYWPLLLVAGGIIFIIYWLLPEKHRRNHHWYHSHGGRRHFEFYSYDKAGRKSDCEDNSMDEKFGSDAQESESYGKSNRTLDKNVIFAGSDQIFLDDVFTGGEINTVFGGMNLDLRRTALPEGETHLEINIVFGGINIYAPNTWLIEIRTDNVCAGFVDNRCVNRENVDNSRKLIIRGSLVFGGGEINN